VFESCYGFLENPEAADSMSHFNDLGDRGVGEISKECGQTIEDLWVKYRKPESGLPPAPVGEISKIS
jgi:hypothetical protein